MRYEYEYEIGKAGDILARTLFEVKEGETFIITADTESDSRVVSAVARGAFTLGAKPMVITLATPLGSYQGADAMLPVDSLTAALSEADVWVALNGQSLLYSTPYTRAMKNNAKLRFLVLRSMDPAMMVRLIGRVDYPVLREFLEKVTAMTQQAAHVRITTPAGGDVEFDNDPNRLVGYDAGYANVPGAHMPAGQIGWSPTFESINGVIVYDGSVAPLGLLKEPISLYVEKGRITKFEGGEEAAKYEAWAKGFEDPQMLKMAHLCYGFHPNALLTGDVMEDERVWGATEWGIGEVGAMLLGPNDPIRPIPAASHSDGICLNSSVWLDDRQITDEGRVIDKDLVGLAKKLGKA